MKGRSLWQDAWRRLKRNHLAFTCIWIVCFYALLALFTKFGWIASNWGKEVGVSYAPPSLENWKLFFGTDIFGRSVVLKTVYGAYVSMTVGLLSSCIAIPIGVVLGASAGCLGGTVDSLVVWAFTAFSNLI